MSEFTPPEASQEAATSANQGILERLRNRWATYIAIGTTAAAITPFIEQQPAAAALNAEAAIIGMPFDGDWAYNETIYPDENGKYDDGTSSHPSVHHTPGLGDWSTDLYSPLEGRAVKLKAKSSTGELSFSWGSGTTSCGDARRVNVLVDSVHVGTIYFAHISNPASTETNPTNGMTIGTAKIAYNTEGKVCNPGRHVHVEFSNTKHYSCYTSHGNPGTGLNLGDSIGVLGANNTGARQACTTESTPDPGSSSGRDLAWWPASTLITRPHPDYEISSALDDIAQPDWATILDYDNDGLDDIVLYRPQDGGSIKVVRKNPRGGWLPRSEPARGPAVGAPQFAAAADLDGNGKQNDLVWWNGNGLSKLIGENFSTTSRVDDFTISPDIVVMDVNQDGRDDLVQQLPSTNTLRVLRNSSAGGWQLVTSPARHNIAAPDWMGVGDFDGDGKAQELAWWNTQGKLSVLDAKDDFALLSTTTIGDQPDWAGVLDYDKDGRDDVIYYNQTNGTINVLRKAPSGGFVSHTDNPIRGPGVTTPGWAGVGDFTG